MQHSLSRGNDLKRVEYLPGEGYLKELRQGGYIG